MIVVVVVDVCDPASVNVVVACVAAFVADLHILCDYSERFSVCQLYIFHASNIYIHFWAHHVIFAMLFKSDIFFGDAAALEYYISSHTLYLLVYHVLACWRANININFVVYMLIRVYPKEHHHCFAFAKFRICEMSIFT